MTDHFDLELSAFARISIETYENGSVSVRPIGEIYKNHPGCVQKDKYIRTIHRRTSGEEVVNMPDERFSCDHFIARCAVDYVSPPEKPMTGVYDEARRAVGHPLGHYHMGITRSPGHYEFDFAVKQLKEGERIVRLEESNNILFKVGRYVFRVHYASGKEADSCLRLETLPDGTRMGYIEPENWPEAGFRGEFLDPRFLIYSIYLYGEFDESMEWQENLDKKFFWASMIARTKAA